MPYQYPKVTDKWEILLALENYKYQDDLFTYMNLLGSLFIFMVKLPSVNGNSVCLACKANPCPAPCNHHSVAEFDTLGTSHK